MNKITGLGQLYVVATPIGNLSDMSFRAVEILRQVSGIAAEDTRHSKKLLEHFQIKTPMQSLHTHNEQDQSKKILQRLLQGESWALISDAGTPLISDPGFPLVKLAHENKIPISPIPGPSSIIAALSVAALPCDRFYYQGFLPHQAGERQKRLQELQYFPYTMIFLESCHRILEALQDAITTFGADRIAVLAHELTKLHEYVYKESLSKLYNILEQEQEKQQGEFVLLIHGNIEKDEEKERKDLAILTTLLKELPLKQAVKLSVEISGGNKNFLYKKALEIKDKL